MTANMYMTLRILTKNTWSNLSQRLAINYLEQCCMVELMDPF